MPRILSQDEKWLADARKELSVAKGWRRALENSRKGAGHLTPIAIEFWTGRVKFLEEKVANNA